MKHLDLFSGIGGFALAARWMGWETVQFVEIDGFCQKVLNKNFPNVPIHGDIKTFDGTRYRGAVDILTGGFPCQPFSVAGKRRGKQDDRFLWPEMFRIIGEIKPRWIVGENVTGILGLALDQVLIEMEDQGYRTELFVIPACAVNAPHRRDRIWILSYPESNGDKRISGSMARSPGPAQKQDDGLQLNRQGKNGNNATNTHSKRLSERQDETRKPGPERNGYQGKIASVPDGWITEPPICGADDGIPNRVDRIKSLGNAIVPQVAFEIFKAIETTLK